MADREAIVFGLPASDERAGEACIQNQQFFSLDRRDHLIKLLCAQGAFVLPIAKEQIDSIIV